MSEPLIDILVATYNGERFVGEQIESIQAQSYGSWRLLVSDDCSSDGTLDVVRRYAAEDGRIRIVSEGVRYGGAKENFFSLMEKSDAPYVMFCDQDDVWREDKCDVEMRAMVDCECAHGKSCPIAVHSNLALIDADGAGLGVNMREIMTLIDIQSASPAQVLFANVATGCTMLLNRACVDEALLGKDLGPVVLHDWWSALVACMLGVRVYLDDCLVYYRQHECNVVGAVGKSVSAREKVREYAAAAAEGGIRSVSRKLGQGGFMKYICQAREFQRVYQDRVKAESVDDLNSVCSLPELPFIRRLAILDKHHLWRKSPKAKFRQLLALGCLE